MWQPIETAPRDQFLLLCGPSGYTTTPMVVTTGRMCSDYHAGRWIDHANDDLTDWGFTPMHWSPLVLPGAQPAPIIPERWKLVPIEPTPEMIDAAEYVDWGDADVRGSCINAWDRMLAAAPEAKPCQ